MPRTAERIWSVLMTVAATQAAVAVPPASGPWRGTIETPGGELPFQFELAAAGDGWQAHLVNGPERIAIPTVRATGSELLLGIDHYDATLTGTLDASGRKLEGVYKRRRGADKWGEARFVAVAGDAPRFAPDEESAGVTPADFSGRWAVRLGNTDAVGVFEQTADGTALGTLLTPGGDYGQLAGRVDGKRLRLSRFEGTHVLLFDGRLGGDGLIHGGMWTAFGSEETWRAQRDPDARLPDSTQHPTAAVAKLDELQFRTVDGATVRLSDPQFRGAGLVIEVLGTWCPNCHDAAVLLEELHREFGGLGVAVVGLAFEVTGDFERDAMMVKRYVERHKLTFPVLMAGRADKAEVAAKLPFLDGLKAYPTTIFLRGDGTVEAVHSGFSGPATGADFQRQREEFERAFKSLLSERKTDAP